MGLSEEKARGYMRRLLLSRMRILNSHGFYGLLLMHMRYFLDEGIETACTDGERITVSPTFLESLSDSELDFVMMHEVLHVVLQHCLRREERDRERFNIACDIVVNSNILLENGNDPSSITLSQWGESMHLAPDGKEGYCYTAEQVYDLLSRPGRSDNSGGQGGSFWDDHSQWREQEGNENFREVWVKRFAEACEAMTVREKASGRGSLPLFAQRMLEQMRKPQVDWRTVLDEFVQVELNDYSFSPPDRRYQDTPFFLPDFNELGKTGEAVDILFMIDTSGSMTDREITAAFSEVKGALEQFDGKLKGWLGFFDAAIIEPQPFENVEDVLKIKPAGGGGTDFSVVFDYVHRCMADEPPACIIILTDGFAPFPEEKRAREIPVLWLIDNDQIEPPWGKVARIEVGGEI